MHGRDNDDTSARCNPCGYNAFSRNNSDDYAVSCGAGAMQKMCLCIPEEWAASHDLRWFGEGGEGVSAQLSWFQVGLAVLWQGDNAAGSESLTLFEDAGALCVN